MQRTQFKFRHCAQSVMGKSPLSPPKKNYLITVLPLTPNQYVQPETKYWILYTIQIKLQYTYEINNFDQILYDSCGPGSSAGIATGYGLDGPGIESRWRWDFPYLSRPALGPTQPPVQWVECLSRGKERPGRDADPSNPCSSVVMKG